MQSQKPTQIELQEMKAERLSQRESHKAVRESKKVEAMAKTVESMSRVESVPEEEDPFVPEEDQDWFCRIFGFFEHTGSLEEYEKTQHKFRYNRQTGVLSRGKKKFKAGFFERPNLQELRDRYEEQQAEIKEVLGGPMLVREVIGDVSAMHTVEENRHALFQVASQFNALEHVSQDDIPEYGITCYADDITQGPACATACAPGTVVRNYFAFEDGGQTQERQIRNLKDIEDLLDNETNKYFEVISGYTMSTDEKLEELTKVLKDQDLRETLKAKLHIGVQNDTQVVASKFGSELYEGPEQIVTQAYCSAISVSYSECDPALWEAFASVVLQAAYEATFYVAIDNALRHKGQYGSKKVFLTSLGGGVFGNDMDWIMTAMEQACEKFKSVGLEIVLVSYGRSTYEFDKLVNKFS